jgi:hypothetical protein
MSHHLVIFFVLLGLHNGVEGEQATTAGFEEQMADGWYYLLDDENPNGYGPYKSRDEALAEAGKTVKSRQKERPS